MPRTNISDSLPEYKSLGGKIIARNTFRYQRPMGDETVEVVRLHNTDIVITYPDGRQEVSSGGWKTMTTKARINDYLKGFHIYSDRGVWYVTGEGLPAVPFVDGMVLPDDVRKPTKDAGTEAKRQRDLKARITKFACEGIKPGAVPKPTAGDCWYCLMFNAEKPVARGKLADALAPQSPASQDVTHLWSHLDEGYMPGALILNAMRFAGYQDAGIAIYMSMGDRGDVATLRRAVRRYMGRKLGLAAH